MVSSIGVMEVIVLIEALDKSLRGVVRSIDVGHMGTGLFKIIVEAWSKAWAGCTMPVRSAKQVKPELNKPRELVMTSALFLFPEARFTPMNMSRSLEVQPGAWEKSERSLP